MLLILASCGASRTAKEHVDTLPSVFPDYVGVTVPYNIAPLNFKVPSALHVQARVSVEGGEEWVVEGDSCVDFPMKKWKTLLLSAKGKTMSISLSVWSAAHPDGLSYKPFPVYVHSEAIDPYVAYRLIPPGYESWHYLSLRQRNLESFEEGPIATNRQNNNGCLNCHSFCAYNPKTLMFHARGKGGGTVLLSDGTLRKVDLSALPPGKNGSYPFWHPSGRYIVFSSNVTNQSFYGHGRDKIEVYDLASDLIIYDVPHHRVLTDKRFLTEDIWETFPAFSPDGKWLYYCAAASVRMPMDYRKLKYSLCRVPFDEETGSLGAAVDTVRSSFRQGGSVSFPRLSPDGRFLLYTLSDCATFPIHHREADLRLLSLPSGKELDAGTLNSNDTESYHAWSSNSRWIVFSSRRIDGKYTRLFFAHIGADGKCAKPFLLPQRDPDSNTRLLDAYNIPEFIKGRVRLNKDDVARLFQ